MRRTKIVATLGPACGDRAAIAALVVAGADVVRLNLSHGTLDEHLATIALVRSLAAELDRPLGVLVDLPGPKIRAGEFAPPGVHFAAGTAIRFEPGGGPSDAGTVRVDRAELLDEMATGDRVVIGDGAISARIREVGASHAVAVVETGGRAQGRPGVHLSSERSRLATPTAADLALAERVAAAGVEYVAVSFVRAAGDVAAVREVVGDRAHLVAKIETSAALADLPAILAASDAIMVARGDLGIDCPLEDVPHLQKAIVRQCVDFAIPVITATQMLESMVSAPSPTRAEVSDVANAVLDGTDALMLSAETAIGRDPALVVATMSRIAERTEADASYQQWAERLGRIQRDHWTTPGDRITAALSHAAAQAARDVDAAAILCCTRSGRTARSMARFRPPARLLGLSPVRSTVDAMTLTWGVEPIPVDSRESTDELVASAVRTALARGRVSAGDTVLVLAGAPGAPSPAGGAAADVLRVVQV